MAHLQNQSLQKFDALFFSHCDSTKVQELLTDENLNERTETGHTLLHIACISGGNTSNKRILLQAKFRVSSQVLYKLGSVVPNSKLLLLIERLLVSIRQVMCCFFKQDLLTPNVLVNPQEVSAPSWHDRKIISLNI